MVNESLLPSPIEERARARGLLIFKPNSIFYFHLFIFGHRHIETNQVSTQFFERMGVREHLPIAGDGLLNQNFNIFFLVIH